MRARPSLSLAGQQVALWGIAACAVVPELALWGADLGLWGSPGWRALAFAWGGFWAGLWHGWQPNYAAQPFVMLGLYPLLHTGPLHMLGNVAGLWIIGTGLLPRVGGQGVALIWVAGALAGGVVFGLLTSSAAPMVGASGAVFALAGAWGWLDAQTRPAGLRRWGRRAGLAASGIAANLVMIVLSPGGIAWETHLGGAVAGIVLGMGWSARRTG